ncbi:hypothetical protein MT356_12300 [Rathayibacter festucae]|uniref:PD-(D/E)XK nuclease domain-containing protein n=1 Tax=Rathayibacter festucae TaxID=110937 RepID=UPI001FB54530|nr:hypothetical protein [Rathayibacter festucae]MCJ1700500.1 hypothetical protein [Rathayibacter festucae]
MVENTPIEELRNALSRGAKVAAVHYACESFNEAKDHPPAISAIAVTSLLDETGGTEARVFSMANSSQVSDEDSREKDLLSRFYRFVVEAPDRFRLHWNMNKATYGFSAIGDRYRFLFDEDPPHDFTADRLFDVDEIIENRYGSEYVKHPKMMSLFRANGKFVRSSLTGLAEAEAFGKQEYGKCERSAAEKTDHIASIVILLLRGALRTANSVGLVKFSGSHLDAVKTVVALGERFRYVERELAHRHDAQPTIEIKNEYDAQDLYRALLKVFFEDVRPEDYVPTYAGASSRIDFVLPDFALAIELKYTRPSMTAKSLGEELAIDRSRYLSRSDVRHLVCLIFDHNGLIRNPRGLEKDIENTARGEDITVTVRIFDR